MKNSRIVISLFYVLTAIWAAGQIFAGHHAGIHYLATISIALAPTIWFIGDAVKRGLHIPHIVQPAILVAWPIVVPLYVLATRRLRGFWLVTVHAIATFTLNVVVFYATIFSFWGQAVFR